MIPEEVDGDDGGVGDDPPPSFVIAIGPLTLNQSELRPMMEANSAPETVDDPLDPTTWIERTRPPSVPLPER